MHASSLALMLTLTLVLVAVARADVAPIDRTKLPAAVSKTVDGYAMKLEPRSYEEESDAQGKVVGYRALLEGRLNSGRELSVELEITATGKIVSENEVVELKSVPAAVTASLAGSRLAKGKVTRAKKVAAKLGDDAAGWELEVDRDGKTSLARFDAAGKLTSTQERAKKAEKQ